MPTRLLNRLKFLLERLILRGALYRLLVIAVMMGLFAVLCGLLVYGYSAAFTDRGDAIWWAFLRLTDPGYLGDDEGLFVRAISTFLTVLGFVLFVGALIAILTQWLNQTIEDLENGYTPVALANHIVILGWTNRTAAIVSELFLAEGRVRRFLRRRGARDLRVAVLANDSPEKLQQELKDRLGKLWDPKKVILRSGTPLRNEHLQRVDFANASTILLPAREFGDKRVSADTQIVKTLLSLRNHPIRTDGHPLPPVVAEIFDADKIDTARHAYGGKIEILSSDSIISRLIAQNVRHRGLSHIYSELLTHGRGNEIYLREVPEFEGSRFYDIAGSFPRGIALGIARPQGQSYDTLLNPDADTQIEEGDRIVILSRSYEDAAPGKETARTAVEHGIRRPVAEEEIERRVLILGWSHRIPALLREFDSYQGERFHIDIISLVPEEERRRKIFRRDATPERVTVGHIEGDYNAPNDLRSVDPDSYDNVVLLGSDWLDTGEEADARTILAYLLLKEILPADAQPQILIELIDAQNLSLFRKRPGEVLISPMILSHMLAQVALRPELRAVFDELFGPGGAEISFVPAGHVVDLGTPINFLEIQKRAAARGEIALGIRQHVEQTIGSAPLRLNPVKTNHWELKESDEIVVLTRL